jgi:hypothetical protein
VGLGCWLCGVEISEIECWVLEIRELRADIIL